MKESIYLSKGTVFFEVGSGIDISIAMHDGSNQVNCFYAPFFTSELANAGSFIGSIDEGGPVNFMNVKMNVHGNGTHTECSGHVFNNGLKVNAIFENFFFLCTVISVYPTKKENGDLSIFRRTLEILLEGQSKECICIRTLPNDPTKRQRHYSGTNPPFIEKEAMEYLVDIGVEHLLIDLPSVDKEEDGGQLSAHKAFWHGERQNKCTITELIYIPDKLEDGEYLLNLQVANLALDAVPSRPILYQIKK